MLHKNVKRFLSLSIAVSLVLGTVGCGGGSKGTSNKPGEVPTISYMIPSDPGITFSSETWSIKKWGEKVGVKFDIISPPRDTFTEKLAATLASGQLPDMINYYQNDQVQTYKVYGSTLFVPLDDYLNKNKLPNLSQWLKKYPDIGEKMRHAEDGKLYGFPLVVDFKNFNALWNIRNDLLKKEGMDADSIKTLDDLKKAMLALKKASGQKYITSSRLGWNYFATYAGAFLGTAPGIMFDNRFEGGSNKFVYAPTQDAYKTFIEFIKWMYDNQLLHPNFVTMQQQELSSGYSEGKFTLAMEQAAMGQILGGGNKIDYPDREEKVIFPPIINGKKPRQPMLPQQNIGFRWPVTISKSSKNIDACMRAMDYVFGDEGVKLMILGEEGNQWTKDDKYLEGVKFTGIQSKTTQTMLKEGKLTQEQFDKLPKTSDLGLSSWWLTGVIPNWFRFNLYDKPISEKEQQMFSINNINKGISEGYTVPTDPIIDFTKAEKDIIAEILTPLDTFVCENSLRFIVGQKPMSEWDSFEAEIKKHDAQKIVDMYNEKLVKKLEKK